MTRSKSVPDAPIYPATPDEMQDLSQLISNASPLAIKYGAVRIDPPQSWVTPSLRMKPDSRFFVRLQTLPAAPFVDVTPPTQSQQPFNEYPDETQPRPTKRRKPTRRIICDDEEPDEEDRGHEGDSILSDMHQTLQQPQRERPGPFSRGIVKPSPNAAILRRPPHTQPSEFNLQNPSVPVRRDPARANEHNVVASANEPDAMRAVRAHHAGASSATTSGANRNDSGVELKEKGPSHAEMMMSMAAASMDLSPMKGVKSGKCAESEVVNRLEVGAAVSGTAHAGKIPLKLRSVPMDASNTVGATHRQVARVGGGGALAGGEKGLAVVMPLSEKRNVGVKGGEGNAGGERANGRGSEVGRAVNVAKVQTLKTSRPATTKKRIQIPRSVPHPFPLAAKDSSVRSKAQDGTPVVQRMSEGEGTTPCRGAGAGNGQKGNVAVGATKFKTAQVGGAEKSKESPSRQAMGIGLLLNPADEPLSRANNSVAQNRGGVAVPFEDQRQIVGGARAGCKVGGSLSGLLNDGLFPALQPNANPKHSGLSAQGHTVQHTLMAKNDAEGSNTEIGRPNDRMSGGDEGERVRAGTQAAGVRTTEAAVSSLCGSVVRGVQDLAKAQRLAERRAAAAQQVRELVDELLCRVEGNIAVRLQARGRSGLAPMEQCSGTGVDGQELVATSAAPGPSTLKGGLPGASTAPLTSLSPQDIETQVMRSVRHAAEHIQAMEDPDNVAKLAPGSVPRFAGNGIVAGTGSSVVSAMQHVPLVPDTSEPQAVLPIIPDQSNKGGLDQDIIMTEPQAIADVLTHNPEIDEAGQGSKQEGSLPGERHDQPVFDRGQPDSSVKENYCSGIALFDSFREKRGNVEGPGRENGGKGSLRLKLKLRETGVKSEVGVAGESVKEEKRLENAEMPSPVVQSGSQETRQAMKVDVELVQNDSLPAKDLKQKRKKVGRQPNKRRINHISHMKWDQDETGRLTKPIIFPDSQTPVTLANYKKKALSFEENLKGSLARDSNFDVEALMEMAGKDSKDWLKDPDVLEEIFWKAIEKGIDGKTLLVPYGVDVEVEGAFDSSGMSYVEWYGDRDSDGRRGRKKKVTKRKAKEEPKTAHGVGVSAEQVTANKNHKIAPTSHVGNLNTKGLLRHMPRMPGINHSMYYVGQRFSRFCWHVEDAFLNSVSYLHPESDHKIWYAVPPSYATKFEDYAAGHIFSDDLLDEYGTGQTLLMNKTTMFDPRKLAGAGIEVYRVVHKPGSFVLTAPRAYHAGFNCGYNVAEAVNYANPTWFPVGREASRYARKVAKPLCVPWEYLLFHEAKATRDSTASRKRAREPNGLEGNAKVLAEELFEVLTQGESAIRVYAEKTNCRIAMLNEINALVQNNQLGPEFGNGAGLVCSVCGHSCHFYAEICGSCDDSFEARCVEHFGQGHKLCLHKDHKTILVRRHDPVLVADILTSLEEVAGIKRSTSELLRRYRGYLRPWETPLKRSGLRMKLNFSLAASRLPPVVAGDKYPKGISQKEKGQRGRKRVEIEVKADSESDFECERKAKRRKSAKRKHDTQRRRPSVEPVLPVVVARLDRSPHPLESSAGVHMPVRRPPVLAVNRKSLKSNIEKRKTSRQAWEEHSDCDSEYAFVRKKS